MSNIGINIVEVDGKATPSIQPAPTSVTGFSIKSQRGMKGEVVRVTNWTQFVEHFGGYMKDDVYGAYALRGFFDNGGTTAYITRVVNTGDISEATATYVSLGTGPWSLTSGDSLQFVSTVNDQPVDETVTFTEGTDGNVGTISNVSADEVVAAIKAELDTYEFKVELNGDNEVEITHPETGAAHSITVTPTTTEADVFTISNTDGADAVLDSNAAVAASKDFDDLTVTAGYRNQEDVGVWGNEVAVKIVHIDKEDDDDKVDRFDLIVNYQGRDVETWTGLSMDPEDSAYVEDKINDEYAGSKFITVDATPNADRPSPTNTETPLSDLQLTGGMDGSFEAAAETTAFVESIDLFDLHDIQLLCCPETCEADVVHQGITHCTNKGDRMFVGHTPYDMEAANIKDGYIKEHKLRASKVYGALYFPWIQVSDPLGSRKWIPPTGHVLGTYARTERERGIWKAPAGNAARLRGALDVRHHITDVDHTSLVKNASVNAVRFISGQGIIIDSSRTLSTNTLWLYVNVRLLFNFVKTSLKTGLRWVVQEPNDETLWNKINYNSVRPFLMGLWRRGAFGPGSPDEVFTVKVDGENNSPENIQQGNCNVEVYFYPSRPAETIVITIGQQEGGASASE